MIKTRLIGQVPSSKKYIALAVLSIFIKLSENILIMIILLDII